MELDKQKKERIVHNDITDLANLKQRVLMTYETVERMSDPENAVVIDLVRRLTPSTLEMAHAFREMREDAIILLEKKHIAGKELAHGAVSYLFGVTETHQIEFPVGDIDVSVSQQANTLHEGYTAHLRFLTSKGVITPYESDGLYVAYSTGRVIQRIETDHDAEGNPAVIAYRDSESQRVLEIISDSPKRLVAEA
jgi:hypothetical protein